MKTGDYVIANQRCFEVLMLFASGDMKVRDVLSGDVTWIDYYVARVIDPREYPTAVLDAMAGISDPPPRALDD